MSAAPTITIDFEKIKLPSTPNYFLIAPKRYCQGSRSEEGPLLPMDLNHLTSIWQRIIQHTPRIKLIYKNPQQHEYSYIQYSRWLRFPDYIYVKFIALNEAESTLIIYSRSKYGYGDFGVNKHRIKAWLEQLKVA